MVGVFQSRVEFRLPPDIEVMTGPEEVGVSFLTFLRRFGFSL